MRKLIAKQEKRVFAIGDQLIVSGTNFTIGLLITRYAGVETYGTYALYWMIFLFLHGLSNAFVGIPAQVVSNNQPDKAAYLEQNNRLGTLLSIAFAIIMFIGFMVYDQITKVAFGLGYWFFPIVIALFIKQEMNRKYFYAKEAVKKVAVIDAVAYFMQVPVLIGLIFLGEIDLNTIVLTMAVFALLGQATFFFLKDRSINTDLSLKALPFKPNWRYGRYLITTSVLQWFSGNVFLISAGAIIGTAAVGTIRVLQNIMGVLHVLFLTMENVVPAKASFLLNQHGKSYMVTYLKKVTVVTGAVYGLLLLGLKLFGAEVLTLLYGAEYAVHTDLLDLFIYVYILVFIGTLAQIAIKSMNLNRGIFIAYVVSVIVTFIITKPLLVDFQIKGVIIGFGILQLVTLTVYLITLKRGWS